MIYSSVGFGGGSSYLAVMAIFSFSYMMMPKISLFCNIVVVTGGCYIFYKSGDLKIAQMAAALEELTDAIEKNQIVDVKFVISKEDYKKLNVITGKDDSEKVKTVLESYLNLEDFNDSGADSEESEEGSGKGSFLG